MLHRAQVPGLFWLTAASLVLFTPPLACPRLGSGFGFGFRVWSGSRVDTGRDSRGRLGPAAWPNVCGMWPLAFQTRAHVVRITLPIPREIQGLAPTSRPETTPRSAGGPSGTANRPWQEVVCELLRSFPRRCCHGPATGRALAHLVAHERQAPGRSTAASYRNVLARLVRRAARCRLAISTRIWPGCRLAPRTNLRVNVPVAK